MADLNYWQCVHAICIIIFLLDFKAMSKSFHTQKYEGYWGLKNLCMPLLSALFLDMLWTSFSKSFRSRFLWLALFFFFLTENKWWIFHSEPKQITEVSLTFVSAFLTFINFLNKVERSKETTSYETVLLHC